MIVKTSTIDSGFSMFLLLLRVIFCDPYSSLAMLKLGSCSLHSYRRSYSAWFVLPQFPQSPPLATMKTLPTIATPSILLLNSPGKFARRAMPCSKSKVDRTRLKVVPREVVLAAITAKRRSTSRIPLQDGSQDRVLDLSLNLRGKAGVF